VNARVLHFYLAGINNQNFLMRDKETGSWWQQITGKAIYGPMQGAALDLVPSDELTFGEWKTEVSDGKVLAPVPKYTKEYDPKWEPEVAKLPVVISFPGTELKSRDVVVGVTLDGGSRAYPWDTLVKQSPVVDQIHSTPLLVVVGPDGKSFRVFVRRVDGKEAEFFLKSATPGETPPVTKSEASTAPKPASLVASTVKVSTASTTAPSTNGKAKEWSLLDTSTASEWNFQGCAISGAVQGKCLDRVPALKDYWFDWRNYHPDTSIYKR
jgi:Protein of unknown function (DUF3179)